MNHTSPQTTAAGPDYRSALAQREPDLRLVVTDMDGTLLDGDGEVPAGLWPLLADMHARGITFVPASGRQYATLARQFQHVTEGIAFIAENGNLVMHDDAEVSATLLDRQTVIEVVRTLRAVDGLDIGFVLCGKRSAYVERTDDIFVEQALTYYAALEEVPDVLAVADDVLKIAVLDFGDAETGAGSVLDRFRSSHQVVVSGKHWVDVMNPAASKGRALAQLQQRLGVTAAQTVVFGDYLNDLEMLDEAEWSFAMANAHPQVHERARYGAPSNLDAGVITVLTELLGAR